MFKTECILQKFEIAEAEYLSHSPEKTVTPYFWSLYENGRVKGNLDIAFAVVGSPKYIIGAVRNDYVYYGPKIFYKIFDYQNTSCIVYSPNLPLTKWMLSDIEFFVDEMVKRVTFELISDFKEVFVFNFTEAYVIKSIQMLWEFFIEMDQSCDDASEAHVFSNYYLARLKLTVKERKTFTFTKYKEIINDKIM